jgi:DNA repair photolyase
MKIIEINTETMLESCSSQKEELGISYSINPYLGCEQGCVFCLNRTISDKFENKLIVYNNALEILRAEMINKYKGGIIGLGTRTEMYQNIDEKYGFCESFLKLLHNHRVPIHVFTKSNRILTSRDILKAIGKNVTVSFSISTIDEKIAALFEPYSPSPIRRLEAMHLLRQFGIQAGVVIKPILPFISDSYDELEGMIKLAKAYRASYILISPALILRPELKDQYFSKIKTHYPGMLGRYLELYKDTDTPSVNYISVLKAQLKEFVDTYEISSEIPKPGSIFNSTENQLNMFDTNE